MPLDSSLLDIIRQQLHTDDFSKEVLTHICRNHASCSTLQESSQRYKEFKWQDNLLFYKNLLYVLDGAPCLQLLEHCHDVPIAGHIGIAKTMEVVKRPFR